MLVVFTQSRSLQNHINAIVDGEVEFRSSLSPTVAGAGKVYLVHAPSYPRNLDKWLNSQVKKGVVVAIADDHPRVESMLAFTELGVQGYFNSYMAAPFYAQMLRLLQQAQSWFPPLLLSQVFALARKTVSPAADTARLDTLTRREKQIAMAVAEGKNNKRIADECRITERTVKSHLTHIFKKLDIKDRVSLAIYLNQTGYS